MKTEKKKSKEKWSWSNKQILIKSSIEHILCKCVGVGTFEAFSLMLLLLSLFHFIWSPHMLCWLRFIFQACRICDFFFLADLASQADKTTLRSLLLAPLITPSVSPLCSRASFLIPFFHAPWVFLSWCMCFLCLLHNSIFIDEKLLPWSSAYVSGHFVKSLKKQKKLKCRWC